MGFVLSELYVKHSLYFRSLSLSHIAWPDLLTWTLALASFITLISNLHAYKIYCVDTASRFCSWLMLKPGTFTSVVMISRSLFGWTYILRWTWFFCLENSSSSLLHSGTIFSHEFVTSLWVFLSRLHSYDCSEKCSYEFLFNSFSLFSNYSTLPSFFSIQFRYSVHSSFLLSIFITKVTQHSEQ